MQKEFRSGVAFYYEDAKSRNVLLWHNCSNKPMRFSDSGIDLIKTTYCEKCPNCGQSISKWEIMEIDKYCIDSIKWDDINFNDNSNDMHVLFSFSYLNLIRIYTEDSTIKVIVFRSYFNLWNGSTVFKKTTFCQRISINIITGYAYKFNCEKLRNKHKSDKKKSIYNISYLGADFDLPADVLNHLGVYINKEMKKVHGKKVPEFESYNQQMSLDNLIFYVRNPYVDPVLYNRIINSSRHEHYGFSMIHKEVLVKNTCKEPIQTILTQSKVPDVKSLRRIAYIDPAGIPLLISISSTFRNVDLIRSLYSAYCKETINEVVYGMCVTIDFSAKIFKTMVKNKDEQIIASKLLHFAKHDKNNNIYYVLSDIMRCYEELSQCDFDFTKNYSIEELHTSLTTSLSKEKTQNRKIDYTPRELSFEMSNEEFSLSLAIDSNELIDTGQKMNICVGSYADKVIDKKSNIFILRNLDKNMPVGCIELNKNTIVQAKGPYNEFLQKQEFEFIGNWITEKGLVVDTNDLIANKCITVDASAAVPF